MQPNDILPFIFIPFHFVMVVFGRTPLFRVSNAMFLAIWIGAVVLKASQ